jgi:hypothetical protein
MDRSLALNAVSIALGIPKDWLNKLIQFESAWNPAARNPISGARGLIQFTNTTAQILGYKNADDLVNKYPDSGDQLQGPVYQYLNQFKPFQSAQSLYMSVFYPAARSWPLSQEFPQLVQSLNPGIKTVEDYVKKVERSPIIKTIGIVGIAGIIGLFLFLHFYKGAAKWQKNQITIMDKI